MKLHQLQEKLSSYFCFTPLDIRRLTGLSQWAVQKIVSRYTHKGILLKIRNGLYMFKNSQKPSPWLIANKLYCPSYISFESALSYYSIIPETVYSTISATTKITRNITSQNMQYIYHKIKKSAFLGYRPMPIDGIIILIAEPEKALADYLYLIFLKKISMNERVVLKKINRKTLLFYVKKFNNDLFYQWVNYAVIKKH